LTLTPMLCARFLKAGHGGGAHAQASVAQGDMFDRVVAAYDRGLHWVLDRQPPMLGAPVATLALTAALYLLTPKGGCRVEDAGPGPGASRAPQATAMAAMPRRQQALAAGIAEDPDVASLSSFTGADGNNASPAGGRLLFELRPRGERDSGARGVLERL